MSLEGGDSAETSTPVQECFDSLWSAVQSVEGASLWTSSMMNTGFNLLIDDPAYRGAVFVVQDDGLAKCDVSHVFEGSAWPQGECAQRVREVMLGLAQNDGRSVVMNHWLPGLDTASVETDVGYRTLLREALLLSGVESTDENQMASSLRYLDDEHVAVMEGFNSTTGEDPWGYSNATIVEERVLCDTSKGHVYVLDRALFSLGSVPEVSPKVLPPLEDYCEDSLYPTLKKDGNFRPASEMALAAYTMPLVAPLTNPTINLTLFAPEHYPTFSSNGEVTAVELQKQISLYSLLSTLPGGYCPSDFGTEGMLFNSLAGVLANESLAMLVKQDPVDANRVNIELLYGDSVSQVYSAYLLAKACRSTMYRVVDVLSPWNDTSTFLSDPKLSIPWPEYPLAQQEDNFGVTSVCDPFIREGPMIIGDSLPQSTSALLSASSSSSLSAGAIAGIVIGSIFGACIIVLLLVWWFKRRREIARWGASPASIECFGDSFSSSGIVLSEPSTMVSYNSVKSISEYTLEDLLLKESEVTLDKDSSGEYVVLGRGRFGKVYRGTLLASEPVAVKCITEHSVSCSESTMSGQSPDPSLEESEKSSDALPSKATALSFCNMSRAEILKEIGLLKSCHSQYIVAFIGAMFRPQEVRLVTELMPCGDLWNALGRGLSPRTVTWYNSGIFVAMDVAGGLNYLHEKKRVIHLDLKSSNILLRQSKREPPHLSSPYRGVYQAKVSDVGLSKILPTSREYLTSMESGGTWNWCAPEVILNTKCTSSADMYSYGVVLWEICTGEIPIRGRMRDVHVPDECPQVIADLIRACVSSDLNTGQLTGDPVTKGERRRPTAAECIGILQRLLEENR